MRIVFLDRLTLGNDINLDFFNALGEVITYDITKPNECLKRVQGADVVVTNKVVIDQSIMDQSDIKLICIAATGMNNIDLAHAKQKNIQVKNVAGYSTHSVAQLTISLVLDFMQHLNYYKNYVHTQQWQNSPIFTHIDKPFHELKGKRWGIIGLGAIGKKVASIATAFDCEVCFHSTSGKNSNREFEQLSLKELLKTSDVITIHSSLNEQTLNLLNADNLSLLKERAIVINVGRGGIIDEKALAEFIDTKEIYVGLDVVSREPIEATSPLLHIKHKERLTITPHVAWSSIEARERLVHSIYENIKAYEREKND